MPKISERRQCQATESAGKDWFRLMNIDTITQKYTLLAESALTQGEMNVASQWLYVIWDTELNNLWSRFSSLANQDIFFTGLVVFLGECGTDQPLTEPAVTPLMMDLLRKM